MSSYYASRPLRLPERRLRFGPSLLLLPSMRCPHHASRLAGLALCLASMALDGSRPRPCYAPATSSRKRFVLVAAPIGMQRSPQHLEQINDRRPAPISGDQSPARVDVSGKLDFSGNTAAYLIHGYSRASARLISARCTIRVFEGETTVAGVPTRNNPGQRRRRTNGQASRFCCSTLSRLN